MEVITDRPGRFTAILAATDALTVTTNRFAAGEVGTEPHVHREHTDAFVVTAGELTVTLGAEDRRIAAGTLVIVPPGVVHAFRNDGPADAEFVNLHLPDTGFAAYLRRQADRFDQHEPPADGGRPATDVVTLPLA